MKKKLLTRRKNAREKRKIKFSKIESTMSTNMLFQVNVPFLYLLKTSGLQRGNIAWSELKSYISLQRLLDTNQQDTLNGNFL